MKPLTLLGILALAFSACTPSPAPAPPAPARTPPVVASPPELPPEVTEPGIRVAPENWLFLDAERDRYPGISLQRAERELLASRRPARTVVVAIIDSGVDTAHADLAGNLWLNPNERANTGRDDDRNGYVDDMRGWNFIGNRDGREVQYDTYEVTRLYAACRAGSPPPGATITLDAARCAAITEDFQSERTEAEQTLQQVRAIAQAMSFAVPLLREAARTDSLTVERVTAITSPRPQVQEARRIYLQLADAGITPAVIEEARAEFESRLEYKLNPSFDPRPIVGDDPANLTQRGYGNRHVAGPDPKHGTHVAGIIGAIRGNQTGMEGIAPAVRLMPIRAVPDGDERDKDIANAIRYAVDNGAHIINMSFGKAYSPHKHIVDDAVRYAESRGVLMVHAAGNDGEDLAQKDNFPNPRYLNGGRARLWIEVGASSWRGADTVAAAFSNFGSEHVDVFAPGEDIYSTIPGGQYEMNSGTSMAAPVVSGLAAMLMAYFPDLTAADVRRIILESATRVERDVVRPGESESGTVPFARMSATGGIVNAYEAVRLAERASRN